MNMIVILTLYPIVFLWELLVGTPILGRTLRLDVPITLFIGNLFSVVLTGYLVPWTAKRLGWWLSPDPGRRRPASISRAPRC